MINRDIAYQKTKKKSIKRVNQFINQLNQKIKERIKKGYFDASNWAPQTYLFNERKQIEDYYKKLNYDCHWSGSDLDFFTVEWYKREKDRFINVLNKE